MPGPSFGQHEVALFDWLTQVARYAQLRPAEAQRLCIDIEMGLASADQPGTFGRLSKRFPSLLELARYAIAGAPVEGTVEHVEVHRAGDIEHACADLTRFDALGLPRPEVSTADAVADFIRDGWDLPGAPAAAWDDALDVLASKGLIT